MVESGVEGGGGGQVWVEGEGGGWGESCGHAVGEMVANHRSFPHLLCSLLLLHQ